MVIYPNAIVDHHFDELNFLLNLMCCLSLIPSITVAFTLTYSVVNWGRCTC